MVESSGEKALNISRENAKILQQNADTYRAMLDYERQRASHLDMIYERQLAIQQLVDDLSSMDKRTKEYKKQKATLDILLQQQQQLIQIDRERHKEILHYNKKLKEQSTLSKVLLGTYREIGKQLRAGWGYLMDSDKVIKQTILNLGMSGAKAEMMRTSFEQSVGLAARLGGDIKNIQMIMEGFADETGRARALMAESVEAVVAIGRGTDLGIDGATKLASQFEFMGKDARETMNYVQGVVDTSERMGVNTSKVLKSISENFKKLSTFTFQAGTKAFAKMAMDAERTRVSMTTALNVAEATRGLEQVIELGANLQVMGGEFAKMDPLHWMYTVRNEPERLTEMLSDMTKGIYTLRQQSDGTFERFISPADRDRLANVAKSLGISNEEMFEIAQRRHDIELMSQSLSGMRLDPDLRQLVEGMAEFDSATGRHFIMMGGYRKDISTLSRDQLKTFQQEQKTLRERAKEAQTFNEVFQATLNELKTALLPLLRTVNNVIESVRPWIVKFTEWATSGSFGWLKAGGVLIAAATAWNVLLPMLGRYLGAGIERKLKFLKTAKDSSMDSGMNATQTLAKGKAQGAAARGAGIKALGTGVGVGAAGAGIGAGVGVAAKGISELADAMSKLTPEQAKALTIIGTTLAVTFPLAAVGILMAGKAATITAPGLLALGASMLMIGGAVGVASWGIGQMAEGLGTLVEKSRGGGDDLLKVGKGIASIAGSVALFTVGGLGFGVFAATMGVIAATSGSMERVGAAFEKMQGAVVELKGSGDDLIKLKDTLEAISKMNIKSDSAFGELANLLKQPLKVEFADAQANFVSNITLEIDGEKLVNKVVKARTVARKFADAKNGQDA